MTTIISRRASALLLTGLAASTLVLGACGDKTAEHTAATAAPAPVSGTTSHTGRHHADQHV
ncbi:hypothetical protein [Gemmatimonas sp.]|uniref:hypothetical protein n=1 Tax=Gemmatimonas sp. TaxID=1962908 RepID=UPI003DA5CD09